MVRVQPNASPGLEASDQHPEASILAPTEFCRGAALNLCVKCGIMMIYARSKQQHAYESKGLGRHGQTEVAGMSYEEEQKNLEKLWNELLSDESDYEIDESESAESSSSQKTQTEKFQIPADNRDSVDQIINQVIMDNNGSSNEENEFEIYWGPVTGQYKKEFQFSEANPGITPELYRLIRENPLRFFQSDGGYLYDVKVYCGQERKDNEELTVPTTVVLDLVKNLLNKSRTACVDNYYTSVELVHELINRETYIRY
ncbi:hypothetical protein ILUMI_02418 [Ignelater luminosus]|uniref:PiggyBac transposable element-derived protein domain-containing protein n=1 Tax=Ignelater luminosus TaxID=2038154 RepID=A0A8K0DI62_IGNLU|nr:hypothetical protein ILUMI_02418 [Ignelater luminosus]